MTTEEKEFTCGTCSHPRRKYSAAITGLVAVGVLLTAMVGYVLTRPTDLGRAR